MGGQLVGGRVRRVPSRLGPSLVLGAVTSRLLVGVTGKRVSVRGLIEGRLSSEKVSSRQG